MAKVLEWIDAWLPTEVPWRNPQFPLRMEETRQDGQVIVRVEVPGINPARDVDVVIDEGTLTVAGRRLASEQTAERSEFSYGEFTRMVTLPRDVDEESARATYRDGILTITMATTGESAVTRHVPIDSGESTP